MNTYNLDVYNKPVSTIGLGTMIFHPDTQKRDFDLMDTFVGEGGTYIDTAEVYGAVEEHGYSEIVIGNWLKQNPNKREKIILGTKGLIPGYCAPLHKGGAQITPENIKLAIDGSLKRLQSDYLDNWMFHRDDETKDVKTLVDVLDEEVKKGRIKSYGASNWSIKRIEEAIKYAKENNKEPMTSASPNFSLAVANEPFWPNTVSINTKDKKYFENNDFLLIAWSALGRGFFTIGDKNNTSDPDLVRVFYNDANFERKRRAEAFAKAKGFTMFEVALSYVINQSFPVVALNGAQTIDEVKSSAKAGSIKLSSEERDYLDLTTNQKPF